LIIFLVVGTLSGAIALQIEKMQHQIGQLIKNVEEHTTHDETLGILKPEWAKVRLEEEILRATRFKRPLSVSLLEMESTLNRSQADRSAALQSLIRLAREVTQPPCVVADAGDNQVLLVLPEYTFDQTQTVFSELKTRVSSETYFPPTNNQAEVTQLGQPLSAYGYLRTGAVSLNGSTTTGGII